MGLTTYLRQRRISLLFLIVSCIVCAAFSGTGVYLRQKAMRRNSQGLIYMAHAISLLKVLNETAPDRAISKENVYILF